ncbi:MAG: hypothetical protein H6541_11425 [Lentimicrobiaceae bacterium]|nr:hypothetical protein [Lentimicrobiaceae bacterium]MCB9024625.1 hypothetical protein [Lentimicrobiaceae bacterium]MCO5264503.1 hypothetical protein [Lentimicrobium sp.]HPG32370.1 hypothetical protein [Lentimicrobium sp.]
METNERRSIRDNERDLIVFLLSQCGYTTDDFPLAENVVEYEGGVMGSINLAGSDPDLYESDLIQAEYTDIDGIEVIITLTKDKNNNLLDLDFWKINFSKLLKYPSPEELKILRK